MLINYLKIALRYLLKNRTFSIITIAGLTLGFTCFLLITLYIYDELSFDLFHKDAGRMYRVLQHENREDGSVRHVASIAPGIAPEAAKQIPEVEDAIRITEFGRATVGNDPASRNYEPMAVADPNFFRFFDFEIIEGDPNTALTIPNGVVITEAKAKQYFGNESPIGKTLWTNRDDFVVTAVVKNIPNNSHLQNEMLFAQATWPDFDKSVSVDWSSNSFATYLKLKPGADVMAAEKKLTELVKKHYPADREFNSTFTLQAMKDIHLHSENIQDAGSGMSPFYIYLFGAVALLVLIIAALNYMNLSTAAAYKRTREIGTRKTLGARKSELIFQFMGEAMILSLLSLLISISIVQIVLPAVNAFTEKQMTLASLPVSWIGITFSVMALTGLLSSLYPAYIISRVTPAEAIKKEIRVGSRNVPMRKILVVVQFSISILMIASTLIIYRQLNFMRSKELGFNVDNLLVIDINSRKLRNHFESVKSEFSKLSEVQSISASTRVPGEWKSFPFSMVNKEGDAAGTEMIFVGIDQDFLNTYHLTLLEGRNFSGDRSDSNKVILTRLAAEELHLTHPVGQMIEIPSVRFGGSIDKLDQPFRAEVIGIADNFHFESFRHKMNPLVFAYPNTPVQSIDYYTLRIQTKDWDSTLQKLKEVNARIDADNPLEYTFLNGRFEEFYRADARRGQVFMIFSFIIVFISCLGLFALVTFSIESRLKEIGIRKVMGASVQNIVGMISKEFLILILAGGIIAIPAAYLIMTNWLSDFAYRVSIGAGTFVMAAVIALTIAFATISLRTLKAAVSNPVDSLKNE